MCQAGVLAGDLLLSVNGVAVEGADALIRLLNAETLPFGAKTASIEATTGDGGGQHTGTTEPQVTTSAGTYKYSIRAEDMEDGKDIGMVDPYLIVMRAAGLDAPETGYRPTPPAPRAWREAGPLSLGRQDVYKVK